MGYRSASERFRRKKRRRWCGARGARPRNVARFHAKVTSSSQYKRSRVRDNLCASDIRKQFAFASTVTLTEIRENNPGHGDYKVPGKRRHIIL